MKCLYSLLLLVCFWFFGCAYIPASERTEDRFVVLENGGPGKHSPVSKSPGTICLQICSTNWEPLFGPDGLGGPREGYDVWTNLQGEGRIYRDPELHESNLARPFPARGTIRMDEAHKKVIVDLQRIISKPGEPEKLEASSANGTYPIKRWIK
jgi:hypothetical protein